MTTSRETTSSHVGRWNQGMSALRISTRRRCSRASEHLTSISMTPICAEFATAIQASRVNCKGLAESAIIVRPTRRLSFSDCVRDTVTRIIKGAANHTGSPDGFFYRVAACELPLRPGILCPCGGFIGNRCSQKAAGVLRFTSRRSLRDNAARGGDADDREFAAPD